MAEITLAKALKVKNRLTGRLAKVQADIQAYNSVPEGQADQVNVPIKVKGMGTFPVRTFGLVKEPA